MDMEEESDGENFLHDGCSVSISESEKDDPDDSEAEEHPLRDSRLFLEDDDTYDIGSDEGADEDCSELLTSSEDTAAAETETRPRRMLPTRVLPTWQESTPAELERIWKMCDEPSLGGRGTHQERWMHYTQRNDHAECAGRRRQFQNHRSKGGGRKGKGAGYQDSQGC